MSAKTTVDIPAVADGSPHARSGGGAAPSAAEVAKADKIVVVKHEQRLYLMRDGEVLKSYRVALGRHPRGTKSYEGDGRTPEGATCLDARNPDSRFYRAFHVSYPNAADRERARELHQTAGGADHDPRPAAGAPELGCRPLDVQLDDRLHRGHRPRDGRDWDSVDVGTPIEIRP